MPKFLKANEVVEAPKPARPTKSYTYLLFLIVLIAASLRFYALGQRGFWLDEAFSWAMTRLSWSELLRALTQRGADMALYYVLLKIWSLLGNSESVLRGLSAVISVITVPLVAELGRRLYSTRVGLFAASFFTVHVFVIRYAQETRSYALVMFFAALGWLQLTRIAKCPSVSNWLLYSTICILGVYSHFLFGLNVAAQFLTLLFTSNWRSRLRQVLGSAVLIALGVLPGILYTIRHRGDFTWTDPLSFADFREYLDSVAGQQGSRIYLVVIGVIFLSVVLRLWKALRREGPGYAAWSLAVPLVGVVFPVVGLAAISFFQPAFVARYLAFTTIPFILGVVLQISILRGRPLVGVTVLFATIMISPLIEYYRDFALSNRFHDFRGAADYISLHQGREDGLVVLEPMARPGIEFYGLRKAAFPEFVFPQSGDRFYPQDSSLHPDSESFPATISTRKRIWVVHTLNKAMSTADLKYVEGVLSKDHQSVSEQRFLGLVVTEYSK